MKTIEEIIERLVLVKEDTQTTVISKDWIKSLVLDNIDNIVKDIKEELEKC